MATFAAGLAAAGAAARLLGRDAQCHSALDFAVLAGMSEDGGSARSGLARAGRSDRPGGSAVPALPGEWIIRPEA